LVGKAAGADIRKMKAVVFNSSGDSVTAVLGGHVDVMIAAAQLAVGHVQGGKLRMIAVASERRLSGSLSEVPTWKELGVDAVVSNWRGVIGPKGMSSEQVDYWRHALERTVATAKWRAESARNLWEGKFRGGEDARKFLDADHTVIRAMLTELGLAK
ncbi:MAG: hypothetical protein KIT18_17685, partial [Burkholderiales bacterium]|nr:hypothetical protein [Burkholderiales bacterium]